MKRAKNLMKKKKQKVEKKQEELEPIVETKRKDFMLKKDG